MNFSSTYTLESKALPGVIVRLRRMGPVARGALELSLAKARSEQRELTVQHESARQKLEALLKAARKDGEGKPLEEALPAEAIAAALEVEGLEARMTALARTQIDPAYVKASVAGFEGTESLTYDGAPATADLLCEQGPDQFFGEVAAKVYENVYLSTESAQNLSSPSTSGAQVDGKPTNSTAPTVSPENSSAGETA